MADIQQTLTKTERNLWNAIISEAMAQLKYNAYAHKALQEGYPEVAQIFQEVSGAENIHGMNHLQVSGEIKASIENLRNVIAGESKEILTMYPRFIKDALEEGRTDAAETFIMAMDRENHHLQVFNVALQELEAKLDQSSEIAEDGATLSTNGPNSQVRHVTTEPEVHPTYTAARKEIEGERWRVASLGRIREVVFGGQDGLLSTMLLVTAVAASGASNTTVLISGLAGALAGMVSMATGAFLGSRSEQDVQRAEIAKEARELEEHPAEELAEIAKEARELEEHPAEELAELVVLYQREGLSFSEAQGVAEHIAADKDLWLRTLVEKELGLSPDVTSNPVKDALAMGAAFIVGAVIPIIPYFFIHDKVGIAVSVSATLVGLFVLGMGKGRIVQKSPVLQGLEILLIGAAAAGVGFGLGEGIPRLI
jgi:VIT1/CCC1 family predicted Fe2+/Mn2+ transporter/rubrerythrin